MNGDPIDPISFEQAIHAIWYRLGTAAGLDAKRGEYQRDDGSSKIRETEAISEELESKIGALQATAYAALMGHVIGGGMRAWIVEGENWKRPPLHVLKNRFMGHDPTGVYLESQDVTSTIAQWPRELRLLDTVEEATPTEAKTATKPPKGKVGRPRGPGYTLTDVRTFKRILKAQRKSGDVRTQHFLVNKFAGNPNDLDFSSNVDRMRKGLPNWLAEIGEQWRRSN